MKGNALILLSGGLDAATCLALAKEQYNCFTISFDYGQKQRSELAAAEALANYYKVEEHIVYKLDPTPFTGSSLTDKNLDVPNATANDQIKSTYVPARNLIFLSIALAYAESNDINTIFFGANKDDIHGFPDCRLPFIESFQQTANLATNTQGKTKFIIKTPLAKLSKAEIIKLATKVGVDFSKTVTCYCADYQGRACGKCDSCEIRRKAFEIAEVKDTTRYR